MGFAPHSIGKYKLGRTIGEGTFAKVKLAIDGTSRKHVAVKIIDKHMVMENNLKSQANFRLFLCFFFFFHLPSSKVKLSSFNFRYKAK